MAAGPFTRPDILVLGAGGTLGEAWMTGVLAGIEDAGGLDLRETESFVGTSAGAIVAVRLAAGRRPRRPPRRTGVAPAPAAARAETEAEAEAEVEVEAEAGGPVLGGPSLAGRAERLAARLLAPASGPVIRLERMPGGLARSGALALLPAGSHSTADIERAVDRLAARFDGRLRVAAVERRSGRRVVFGAPGAPAAPVGRAVAASCAIPGYFRPVRVGRRDYVDGAAWSLTNLDAAPAGRRTEILCLNPTAGLPLDTASPLGLLRAALVSRQLLEAAWLHARGARLRAVGPRGPAARLMAPDLMDGARRAAVLRAGYAQGLALA